MFKPKFEVSVDSELKSGYAVLKRVRIKELAEENIIIHLGVRLWFIGAKVAIILWR